MKRLVKKLQVVLVIGCLGALCAGCSIPCYNRTVVRSYDANGNLTSTVITENVNQIDPNSKPLLPVLRDQKYTK